MLKVFIGNASQGETEYTRFVVPNSISIQRTLNAPSICKMKLVNVDNTFTMPPLRSYIRIFSSQLERNLFTGWLTNDPTRSFVGLGPSAADSKFQIFNFDCVFTSDEYLLNIKSVPFIPAFVNQPQGYILQSLAQTLCPGFFNFEHCASGDLVPYYQYDPTKSWSEVAKIFGDASRYRYSVINKEIHYQPYGDGLLGVEYDENKGEGTFDPRTLETTAVSTPIVNDVTVVGAQEPGNMRHDHFIGDGFDGAFGLKHKVYGLDYGTGNSQGSSILLADTWNNASINAQTWQVMDPSNNFIAGYGGASALNILSAVEQAHGTSFIAANNAVELAGGKNFQHGEIVFNDYSSGIIGGIYDSEVINGYGDIALADNKCEAGFLIAPTQTVVLTASGASGIAMYPFRMGSLIPKAFQVVSKINKSYTLSTSITAPAPSRYTQTYRTISGVAFGGSTTEVQGTITWKVTETDAFTGVQTFYTFSLENQTLPVYALYAVVNNYRLNITMQSTQVTTPILGSLGINCKIGAGLLAPIYISGQVQYTGAFVTPSGGNLPILPAQLGPENKFPMSTGIGQQAAEISSGQTTDTLNFYSDDLPGVGTRIHLNTWESQAAVSRVRNLDSIKTEATVVGDDGVRSAIVTDLNPLPRTSEDCDFAGQAFLSDRTSIYYQGQYVADSYFFNQLSTDIDYYPVCGRFLNVNSPQRGITKQRFLVTSVTTEVSELSVEHMSHTIQFGPDLTLEKTLAVLNPIPQNVLQDRDVVTQPTPQELLSIGTNYLPDMTLSSVQGLISGGQFYLSLQDTLPVGAHYELRNADLNWGKDDSRLISKYTKNGTYLIKRQAYDQTWYMRMVNPTNASGGFIQTSRRTEAVRIVYPMVPAPPAFIAADTKRMQFDFSGDVRNVAGIELRGTALQWSSGTYFSIGDEIQDPNGNIEKVLGSQTVNVIASTVVDGPVPPFIGYVPTKIIILDLDKPYDLYTRQLAAIQGLEGASSQLAILNDPNYVYTIHVNSPTQIYIQVVAFGLTNQATFGETAQLYVAGSDSSVFLTNQNTIGNATPQVSGDIPPTFAASGQFATYDSGVVWGNTGKGTLNQTPVYYDGIVGSEADMDFNMDTLRGRMTPGETTNGPIGQYQVGIVPSNQRVFYAYFFNLMWEYSDPLYVYVPPPKAPFLQVGYFIAGTLQLMMSPGDPSPRSDIKQSTIQLARDQAFTQIVSALDMVGTSPTFTINAPTSGDLWARARVSDYVSSGPWSQPLFIPQTTLINSAYLSAQGSVPPTVVQAITSAGGIFTYYSSNNFLNLVSTSFTIEYPNGSTQTVPATSVGFNRTVDSHTPLSPSTPYGFFPSLSGAMTINPTVQFNGPYASLKLPSAAQFKDGSVPLTNGVFICTTSASASGAAGGAGGGTEGGGNCGVLSSRIRLANGYAVTLEKLHIGSRVRTIDGRISIVHSKRILQEYTAILRTSSGLTTECAYGHTLRVNGKWMSLAEIVEDVDANCVSTINDEHDQIVDITMQAKENWICRIELRPEDGEERDEAHVYELDGMWSHNTVIKNDMYGI